MDHERFKNLAAAYQSVVVATAVILGGVWSACVLHDVARSRAELEKLRHSAVALDLSISVQPLAALTGAQRELIVEVTVKNIGAKYVYLDLRKPVLQARRVTFSPESGLRAVGDPIASHYYGPSLLPYSRFNLVPGASSVLPFFVRVPSAGVYLLTFKSEMPPELGRDLEKLPAGSPNSLPAPGPPTWVSQKIVNVQ